MKVSKSAYVVSMLIKGIAICVRPLARPMGWLVGGVISKLGGLKK